MKIKSYIAFFATLMATSASAHDGIHLHPHGFEMLTAGLALFAVVGGAVAAVLIKKGKK